MAADVLGSLGKWFAIESAVESGVPLAIMGGTWWWLSSTLSMPTSGRPLTLLEAHVVLGAAVALTGWAISRQMVIMGRRTLWTIIGAAVFMGLGLLWITRATMRNGFESACKDIVAGEMADVPQPDNVHPPDTERLCRVGGVPGNPYLPGTLVRAGWDGRLGWESWGMFAVIAGLGALAYRDQRISRSAIPAKLHELLRLAPAAGADGVIGGTKDGKVAACVNPTLWGEVCGQLYPAATPPSGGAWCIRCQQPFTPAERILTFNIVTLFTHEIDILNGLERLDTLAWPRGQAVAADARLSGMERWVTLGKFSAPDVLTVAQFLALLHEQLDAIAEAGAEGDKERWQKALKLAKERASRVCAWIWFGQLREMLTYAQPTSNVRFAVGSNRLRDLVGDSVEELTLQLDIGLLPLEVRTAFRMQLMGTGDIAVQNNRIHVWIPVSPPSAMKSDGVWVDRIEGEALRSWLSTARIRQQGKGSAGADPLPYLPSLPDQEDPTQDPYTITGIPDKIRPGSLDLVAVPRRAVGDDVLMVQVPGKDRALQLSRSPGDAISEWQWFDGEQIQLLRQRVLVLVSTEG